MDNSKIVTGAIKLISGGCMAATGIMALRHEYKQTRFATIGVDVGDTASGFIVAYFTGMGIGNSIKGLCDICNSVKK